MYLGVDIGGTKTLVATLSDDGKIIDSRRFASDHNYAAFLHDLEQNLNELHLSGEIQACAGVSGLLDRDKGIVHALGNLPWTEVPVADDIAQLIGGGPVIIENDSRLAGLSEAQFLKDKYRDILYMTVSTGIGGAFIQNGRIATALQDMEMGKMPLLHDGTYVQWEEFASGRAIVARYGKPASEIDDPAVWHTIGTDLAHGLGAVCSILQPDVIIVGGGVGQFADKYKQIIWDYLEAHLHAIVVPPQEIVVAQRPDEAVIYGCYELLRQTHG